MRFILTNFISVVFLIIFLSSCSFFKKKVDLSEYVLINSNPTSAEIYSDTGELLGVTPFKFDYERLNLIQKNSIVSLSLKKLNYIERQVVFKNPGVSEITITLMKIGDQSAKELIGGPLSREINEILKKMIQIQEGIITKKILSSEETLKQLTKDFPNIASFYVLESAIDIQNKKFDHAKIVLEKALMLDGSDELARSYLNFVNKRLSNE